MAVDEVLEQEEKEGSRGEEPPVLVGPLNWEDTLRQFFIKRLCICITYTRQQAESRLRVSPLS